MLLERNDSCLILVDVQEKLAPYVQESKALIERCERLLKLAKDLAVPTLVTEQYPAGLSGTVVPLVDFISKENYFEKVSFSCVAVDAFKQKLKQLNKKQLVLIGIETHVCVMQTAFDLQQEGYEVYIVVDAVSSRFELDHKYGLKRMKQAGMHLITSEMVFFEWLKKAGTPEFKSLSKEYLKANKDK